MNNEAITMTMARKLIELRTAKGITQEVIADIIGVSNKTISKWENGASSPEVEYIPILAEHFGVSIDELFGKDGTRTSVDNIIADEFTGLSTSDGVLKSFELAIKIISGCIRRFIDNPEADEYPIPKHIISKYEDMYRTVVSNDIVYEIAVNNRDVNMAVMLFGNEANFNWINNNINDIKAVFEFLSVPEALKITSLIHNSTFPKKFTVDYIAKKVVIETEKATELLEMALKIKLCSKSNANLREGKVDLYEANGNGMILSIITLAYEHMCGIDNNQMGLHGSVKMIRGDK